MSIGQDRSGGGFGKTSTTRWWTEQVLAYSPYHPRWGYIASSVTNRISVTEDTFLLHLSDEKKMTRH